MTIQEQQKAAENFYENWKGRGDEKSETHNFWIELLRSVLGVENPESFIEFEKRVQLGHTSFIDGYIPSTKVLIEQKSIDIDLKKAYKQSDGNVLTPFQQADRYASNMNYSERPRWIVTCNFKSFLVYDMENRNCEPQEILLENLGKDFYRLSFLASEKNVHLKREMELSIKAGEIIGEIYDKLLLLYKNPESEKSLKSLNMLCVRLVFCLYAEDAGLFKTKSQFHDYIESFKTENIRQGLLSLFKVLDTKIEERDPELEDRLADFPYVNGGLFTEEDLSIPVFSEEVRNLLLEKASEDFNWADISPTIFGAVFESTLNPETRRSGGMHYTSIENIHKVIDPLFLDGLKAELAEIKKIDVQKKRIEKVHKFQEKISSLKFLDPACGSGNFLTESFLSLARLEIDALKATKNPGEMFVIGQSKVSIQQFYGIEINDFAVTVAKTALWIAESQVSKELNEILFTKKDFLPLRSYANIIEGNALQLDWAVIGQRDKESGDSGHSSNSSLLTPNHYDYVMGNPPFVGAMWMKGEKRKDIELVFPECKKPGEIDYVSGWYAKAAGIIQNTKTRCAFVSTNSICQGQQVELIWKPLFEKYHIHFDFAYRTFRWDSEASLKAHVHCVIIGFSFAGRASSKFIISESGEKIPAKNINGYLLDAPDIFVESRNSPVSDIPQMMMGSMPRDGGGFVLSEDEKNALIKKEPLAQKWIRLYLGADEYLNAKKRYCLWLVGANPGELKKCPEIVKRVEKVRDFRLASKAEATRKFAETPTLFCQIAQPKEGNYIIVPKTSSERRKYIPIGFLKSDVIASDLVFIIPGATLFHFGVLTSNVHMAWMRAVCGRLEMRYRYSAQIVYNNFPWPRCAIGAGNRNEELGNSKLAPSSSFLISIEQTAQAILDARAKYPESSLADLYDPTFMPKELLAAHRANDRAVMEAYGFDYKTMTESECVAELFKIYEKLVQNLNQNA